MVSGKILPELVVKINEEIARVCCWFRANKLALNPTKSNFIVFHSRRLMVPENMGSVLVENAVIQRVTEVKFLGVYLDETLKFDLHVAHLVRKLSRFIAIIYKIKRYFTLKGLVNLYYALIYPNLTFCITVWGATFKNVLRPLQVVQNRIVRAMCGVDRLSASLPLYTSLGLFNVENIYMYMTGAYVYRTLLNQLLPTFQFQVMNRVTRSSSRALLSVPFVALEVCRRSIRYSGPVVYNRIPLDIRTVDRYTTFKRNFKRFLLDST